MVIPVDFKGSCFCIITGASQGIGRAIAVECSKLMGPNSLLLLLARSENGLTITKSLTESPNVKVIIKSADLSNISSIDMEEIIKKTLSGSGKFDLNMIIHNVGSTSHTEGSAKELCNTAVWQEYYNLNVFNVAALNGLFLKTFKNQDEKNVVVNISSLCGIKPFIGLTLYGSGKAAREMYFKVLAEENPNLRVLNYAPGPVQTAMVQDFIDHPGTNDELQNMFTNLQKDGKLLQPQQTAKKFIEVLIGGKYNSGDHVDYFD